QRFEAGEIELRTAPLQDLERLEIMGFEPFNQRVVKWIDAPRDAESAIANMPARPTRDLAKFGGAELAMLITVELPVLGECHMIEVEVESHADGVRGNQVVNVA